MFDLLTGSGWIIPLALAQTVAFILLIRFLDLYEREPLLYLAFMALWGGTVAVVAVALLNGAIGTFLSSALSPEASAVFGPAISAPLVEELAKGMALGIAFQASYWWSRRFGGLEFEGVTDGIVYGAAIGLGFAFTENVVFFLTSASQEGSAGGKQPLPRPGGPVRLQQPRARGVHRGLRCRAGPGHLDP